MEVPGSMTFSCDVYVVRRSYVEEVFAELRRSGIAGLRVSKEGGASVEAENPGIGHSGGV